MAEQIKVLGMRPGTFSSSFFFLLFYLLNILPS